MTQRQIPVPDVDVVVVGAGMGGIYAVRRFVSDGLTVAGFELAPEVGGVWYHNRYPGARVDVEAYDYCYFFDPELYREWKWSERYPTQPEILAYLNHVADRYDIRRHFTFEARVTGARWDEEAHLYSVTTDTGLTVTARYLVMATGQLSQSRKPDFPGLDDFTGEWVQTARWPERDVRLRGRKVAVIGTGSSGAQVIPSIAPLVDHLFVFQRTPNYAIPARNAPVDQAKYARLAEDVPAAWKELLEHRVAARMKMAEGATTDLTAEEQQAHLEERWRVGGQGINATFTDQGSDMAANLTVSHFVREKVRSIVHDPSIAEKLVPNEYPIGARPLTITTDYYETFNRENVTLVDLRDNAIERITPTGLRTQDGREHDVDLIIFALGFTAFTGALDQVDIRNAEGVHPSDRWRRGPKAFLGLLAHSFPNLFIVTGPGSPSVLANMIVGNVQHVDFAAELMAYMRSHDYTRVEPTLEAEELWYSRVQDAAPRIRLATDNYMTHVNDDGSRYFVPYAGGFDRYVKEAENVVASGYAGLEFS